MTAPLTDEQVAYAVSDYDDVTVTNALAREVQAYRALRPDCPTCGGKGFTLHEGKGDGYCPDCTDGKMPLDKWVALAPRLLAVGLAVYTGDGLGAFNVGTGNYIMELQDALRYGVAE